MPEPLDGFDVLYRHCMRELHMHPRDVDQCEVWEIARLLGLPDDLPASVPMVMIGAPQSASGPSVRKGGGSSMGDDLQAKRVAAARGEAAPPDWT
jgi:hypothetical protein